MIRLGWVAAFISSLCTVICIVWALDKHWYAKELTQQVAQLHFQVSQAQQIHTQLQLQNQRLKYALHERQAVERSKTIVHHRSPSQPSSVGNEIHIKQ